METPKEINVESKTSGRLNSLVAISVALLAAFMAVTKVKDDNIVQAMLQAKSDAVDTWGEYQAKRIKHHLVELGRDQMLALRTGAAAQSTAEMETQAQHYQTEIDHLGIARSPAFHYEPETNGCAEKAIQILKEQLLWIERYDTLDELRAAVRAFGRTYNQHWLIERHRYRTPIEAREHLRAMAAAAA